jgi:hypothetical protein
VVITFRGIALKSGDNDYEILSIKDSGTAMRRRNVKVQLFENSPSEDKLREITQTIWQEHGHDVEEVTTVFYLPGMDPRSLAYAFGGCMEGKGCYFSGEGEYSE